MTATNNNSPRFPRIGVIYSATNVKPVEVMPREADSTGGGKQPLNEYFNLEGHTLLAEGVWSDAVRARLIASALTSVLSPLDRDFAADLTDTEQRRTLVFRAGDAACDERPLEFLRWFGLISRCDAYTIHAWDAVSNRTVIAGTAGLRWPQLMVGFSAFSALPRETVFADDIEAREGKPPPPLVDMVPSRTAHESMRPGSFHSRELVRECWRVSLRWPQGRAAMFLNWRREPDKNSPLTEPRTPRDLRLAARLLVGVLTELGRPLVARSTPDPRRSFDAGDLHAALSAVLDSSADDERLSEQTRRLVHTLVSHLGGRAALSFVENDNVVFRHQNGQPAGDSYLVRGATAGLDPNQARRKTPGERGRSLAALACEWNCPILLRDTKDSSNTALAAEVVAPPESGQVRGPDGQAEDSHSEAAVPLRDSEGKCRGVLNIVECSREKTFALTPGHVRLSELWLDFAGRLREHRKSAIPEAMDHHSRPLTAISPAPAGADRAPVDLIRSMMGDWLVGGPASPRQEPQESVLCSYTKFARAQLGACLAYVLKYDPQLGYSRASCVAWSYFREASNDNSRHPLAKYVFDEAKQPAALNRLRWGFWHHYKGLFSSKRADVPDPDLEGSLINQLLPRRDGFTREVFATGKPVIVLPPDVSGAGSRREMGEFCRRYFGVAMGLPFKSGPNAQPEAVLWLCWRSRRIALACIAEGQNAFRAGLKDSDVDHDFVGPVSRDKLTTAAQKRLEPITSIAAALVSLLDHGLSRSSEHRK